MPRSAVGLRTIASIGGSFDGAFGQIRYSIQAMRKRNLRRRARTQGFSLIELATVISIVGLLAAVGIPAFQRSIQNSEVRSNARAVLSDLQSVRTRAMTREAIEVAAPPPGNQLRRSVVGATPTTRARLGGMRILSNRSYVLYVSDGLGNEQIVRAHTIPDKLNMTIVNPAVNSEIRFRSDGTLMPSSPTTIELLDGNNQRRHQITLSVTGRPTVKF